MNISIIGHTKDLRTNAHIIYALASIDDYLVLVGDKFDEFDMQRKEEKHKAYQRMNKDIMAGAVLPPITLAIKPENVDILTSLIVEKDLKSIENALNQSDNNVFILDGLQRTHLLSKLKKDNKIPENTPKLLLEIWIEKDIKHLIYRIIILNAGRKAMSLRHQIELLFSTIYDELKREFTDTELWREVDQKRRTKAKVYTFEAVITSYNCFLTKNYEPSKENLITQQVQEESVIYSDENELNVQFELFKKYFGLYLKLDEATFSLYQQQSDNPDFANWWAKENVMNAFFAALSLYGNNSPDKQQRIITSIEKLLTSFANKEEDILGLTTFESAKTSINPSRKNIGLATKRLLFEGFREYFINAGEQSFDVSWNQIASIITK
jgi:hypothetical protein